MIVLDGLPFALKDLSQQCRESGLNGLLGGQAGTPAFASQHAPQARCGSPRNMLSLLVFCELRADSHRAVPHKLVRQANSVVSRLLVTCSCTGAANKAHE